MRTSALPAEWKEEILEIAADRYERRLAVELSELKLQLRTALHEELTHVRREIATTRFELMKWSLIFWVGQVAAIGGLLAFTLRAR
jgi:hypothetical protein